MTQPYTDADVEVAELALCRTRFWLVAMERSVMSEDDLAESARAVLSALAAAGRLTPAGGETRTEWGVWWHAGDSDGIVLDEGRIGSRERADRRGGERIGDYGITRYTLHRREHRDYADGSTLVGPWLPVPEEDTDVR